MDCTYVARSWYPKASYNGLSLITHIYKNSQIVQNLNIALKRYCIGYFKSNQRQKYNKHSSQQTNSKLNSCKYCRMRLYEICVLCGLAIQCQRTSKYRFYFVKTNEHTATNNKVSLGNLWNEKNPSFTSLAWSQRTFLNSYQWRSDSP